MNKFILLAIVCLFSVCAESKWTHEYDSSTGKQLAGAIKQKLLANIDRFANTTMAGILKADLIQGNDSNRKLKELDEASLSQIFSLFNLSSKNCKLDADNFLRGDGLQCLNQIWKNYIPK